MGVARTRVDYPQSFFCGSGTEQLADRATVICSATARDRSRTFILWRVVEG